MYFFPQNLSYLSIYNVYQIRRTKKYNYTYLGRQVYLREKVKSWDLSSRKFLSFLNIDIDNAQPYYPAPGASCLPVCYLGALYSLRKFQYNEDSAQYNVCFVQIRDGSCRKTPCISRYSGRQVKCNTRVHSKAHYLCNNNILCE